MGFERTPEQCRVRIKSLKRQFLLTKEGNLRNNGQYHKIFKFYEIMERILSSRPALDPQEFIDGGAGGEEPGDGMEEDGEEVQDVYNERKGECPYPAETEVKLEYPTVPISIPVKVTVGNSSKCVLLIINMVLCANLKKHCSSASHAISLSPLQALPLDCTVAASRPIICPPRQLNEHGSGELTSPWKD